MKQNEENENYGFAMTLLAEMRLQNNKLIKFTYFFMFICIALLSYIFYDRYLDSQTEHSIVTENILSQDNQTGDNISNNISNNIK